MAILFDEWTAIWESSGAGNSDKTCAVYISKLQHSGMLKGDDITDRFFRILLVGYLFAVFFFCSLNRGRIKQAYTYACIDNILNELLEIFLNMHSVNYWV